MNEIISHLNNHKSIRNYQKKEIPDEILNQVLESALRASSSGNMQSYSIIVTKDEKMKQKLYKPHFEQSMVLEAPVFLTFCADFHRMKRWLEISDAPDNFDNYMSFMISSIDAILASANAAIAAESLGLGLCYLGTTLASAHEIGEILDCPKNVVPVAGFSLGYPDEEIETRDRLPLSGLIHQEKYHHYNDEEVLDIYKEREAAGMKRYSEVPRLKEMIEKVGAKNLAQVYTKAKYTKESHEKYSSDLLGYLKDQSFLN